MEFPIVGNTKPNIQVDCEPNFEPSPHSRIWVRIIGTVYGNLLRSCGSAETRMGKMSEGHSRSYAKSGSGRSSQGSTWQERRQKRREDREHE